MGTAERKQILDALRVPVEKDLRQRVRFEVDTIRAGSDFAGVIGRPVKPNGDAMDYSHTQYQNAIEAGAFDDGVMALLKRTGGRWHVLEYQIGATDYPADGWLYEHRVPANVFASSQ